MSQSIECRRTVWVIAAVMLMLPTSRTLAAEQGAEPRVIVTASAASVKAFDDEADRLGIPLPPYLTQQGIEQYFPFIGNKGLTANAPIGIIYAYKAHWGLEAGEGMLFVLPVQPNVATVDSFKAMGGNVLADHPDSVEMNGNTLRRTSDALIFGESVAQSAIVSLDADALKKLYKTGAANAAAGKDLLRVIADVKGFRQTDTSDFFKFLEKQDPNVSAQDRKTAQEMSTIVENMVKKIDTIELSAEHSDQSLVLNLSVAPVKLPAAGSFKAPGMPDNVVASVNIAASLREVFPNLDDFLQESAAAVGGGTATSDENTLAAEKALVDLLAGGKSLSIGGAPKGRNGGIVYLVEQGPTGKLEDQMKLAADTLNAADKHTNNEVQHYTSDAGLAVVRLVLTHTADSEKVIIDGVEKNGSDYFTLAESDDHLIDPLVAAPQGPAMSDLLAGTVWLDRMFKAVVNVTPDLRPAMVKDLTAATAGKTLAFSATAKDGSLVITTHLPEDLIKTIMGAFGQNTHAEGNVGN